ncbi:MAG: TIGR03545 family protein [Spirochaetaceae bacterium]|nr:TIGR03545 family protein [Spirochaetaceae bacterium]
MGKAKVPYIFDDDFSEKEFEKNLLSKIYVPADQQFISSLYEKSEEGIYSLKENLELSKQEQKKLKTIATQIKKQKGRVKLIPLAVTIGIIVLLVLTVNAFKNTIVKKGMTMALESVFGAKCDISSVNLKIFDSSLRVKEIAVANKDEPMKNLFELSDINVDFDLVQLLKGRFVMDEILAEGIQLGTDREVSGELPNKKKDDKKEELTEEEKAEVKPIQQQIADLLKEKTGVSAEGITHMFSQYDPKKMVNDFYDQMQSPKIIQNLQPQAENLVSGWKTTAEQMDHDVKDFIQKAQALVNTDISKINDPVVLKQLLENLNAVRTQAETIKTSVESAVTKVKDDAQTVNNIANDMKNAVNSDFAMVDTKVKQLSSLDISKATRLFSGDLDQPALQLISKYLPTAKMVLDKVQEFQQSGSKTEKEKKTKKKTSTNRLAGRTVEYRKDNVPNFLVRNLSLSGKDVKRDFALSGNIKNISNDCDKLDKPVEAFVKLNRNSVNTETLSAVVDMRKNRVQKAISASLTGSGYSFNDFTLPNMENTAGIPFISGLANIKADLAFDTDLSFDLAGALDLTQAAIKVKPFEPEFAYSMYTRAVEPITQFMLSANAGYDPKNLLKLLINSDLDKKLSESLQVLFKQELTNAKLQIENLAKQEIEKLTGPLEEQLSMFGDIKSLVNVDGDDYSVTKKLVETRISEIQKKLTGQLTNNEQANQIMDQMPDGVKDGVKDVLKKFF